MELGRDMCSAVENMQSRVRRLRMAGMLVLRVQSEEVSLRLWHLHGEVSVEGCGFISTLRDFVIPHPAPLLVELYRESCVKLRFCQLFFLSLRKAANEAPQRKKLERDNKQAPFLISQPWNLRVLGNPCKSKKLSPYLWGQQSPTWSWRKILCLSQKWIVDYSRSHSTTRAWDTWQDSPTSGHNILHMLSGLLFFKKMHANRIFHFQRNAHRTPQLQTSVGLKEQ